MVLGPFLQDVVFLGHEAPVTVDVVERQVGADVEVGSGDETGGVEEVGVANGGEGRAAEERTGDGIAEAERAEMRGGGRGKDQ